MWSSSTPATMSVAAAIGSAKESASQIRFLGRSISRLEDPPAATAPPQKERGPASERAHEGGGG